LEFEHRKPVAMALSGDTAKATLAYGCSTPIEQRFELLASTLAKLFDGWYSERIIV
jgi:hypothetical protein